MTGTWIGKLEIKFDFDSEDRGTIAEILRDSVGTVLRGEFDNEHIPVIEVEALKVLKDYDDTGRGGMQEIVLSAPEKSSRPEELHRKAVLRKPFEEWTVEDLIQTCDQYVNKNCEGCPLLNDAGECQFYDHPHDWLPSSWDPEDPENGME